MTAVQVELGRIKSKLDEQDKFAIKVGAITATLVTVATIAVNVVLKLI